MTKNYRSLFTSEEDAIIKQAVKEFGDDWDAIAARLKGRFPRQVRDRYNNYLTDTRIISPFTSEEDEFLIDSFNKLGPSWTLISSQMPGRSANDIKNRWHRHLKKKISEERKNKKKVDTSILLEINTIKKEKHEEEIDFFGEDISKENFDNLQEPINEFEFTMTE